MTGPEIKAVSQEEMDKLGLPVLPTPNTLLNGACVAFIEKFSQFMPNISIGFAAAIDQKAGTKIIVSIIRYTANGAETSLVFGSPLTEEPDMWTPSNLLAHMFTALSLADSYLGDTLDDVIEEVMDDLLGESASSC